MNRYSDFLDNISAAPNLGALFWELCEKYPERVIYRQAEIVHDDHSLRRWSETHARGVQQKVSALAQYLLSLGVKPGDRIAILSFTRPEWLIADLAILVCGAVSVSVYQSLNVEETGYILFDSGANIVFAENREQGLKLSTLLKTGCPIPATEEHPEATAAFNFKQIISFEQIDPHPVVIGLDQIFKNPIFSKPISRDALSTTRSDLASLVYTSGTTGPPKGVMQTHGNHLANIYQASKTGLFAPEGTIFLFLPLAHSFARLIGYLGFMTPTTLDFPAVVDRETSTLHAAAVLRDLRESNAQVVPSVPRILEKMVAGIRQRAAANSVEGLFLDRTIKISRKYFEQNKAQKVSLLTTTLFTITAQVRKRVRENLFGKAFSHAVSGGAKLPVEVNEFFSALGISVYEGYGLTETCVATNVNRLGQNKIGSVGPVLDGIEIKIDADGEILFRGPNITSGYYNRPAATKACWDADGWFHTGDIGRLDDEGFLYITGRKKELIVTAGGKKVAPQPIEERLQASPFISQALVYGEGKPFCIALVTLERETILQYLRRHAGNIPDNSDLTHHPQVQALIEKEIGQVNAHLSRYESLRAFRIIPMELTVDNGLLTPTFKIKRAVVVSRFKSLIEDAYFQPHSHPPASPNNS